MTSDRALLGLLITGSTGGATYLSWQYYYFFIEQFGLLLVIGPGIWVGVNVAMIVVLQNDERNWRRALGETWGAVFFYSALLQAVLFLVIIFMTISLVSGSAPLPDSSSLSLDIFVGAGYLSSFIFGSVALYCVFMGERIGPRLLGMILLLLTVVLPLYALIAHEEGLAAFHDAHPSEFVWLGIGYLAVFSAVTMQTYRLASDIKRL